MLSNLICELVTPEKLYFSGEASMVEAPGTEGDFGVLAGHMPFVSTLKPGVVKIHRNDSDDLRLFVTGGLAEVTNERCTILAEHVEDVAQLSLAEVKERLAGAREDAASKDNDLERAKAEKRVAELEALVIALSQ